MKFLTRAQDSIGVRRYHRALFVVLFGILSNGCDHRLEPTETRLSAEQTLRLSQTNPYAMEGNHKYHLYRLATPEANAALVEQCRDFPDSGATTNASPLILGYTGGPEEAEALIEVMSTMAESFATDPERYATGRETTFLTSAMIGLGLMGRGGITEARKFLTEAITSDNHAVYQLRWYNQNDEAMVLELALTGFVIMQPDQIEPTLAAAKSRIKRKYPRLDWHQVSLDGLRHYRDMVTGLERQRITSRERELYFGD